MQKPHLITGGLFNSSGTYSQKATLYFHQVNQVGKAYINRVAKHAGKQPNSKWHDDQRTTDTQAAEFAQVVLQSGARKSGAFEVSSPGSATFLLHKGPRLENSSLPTWNHDLHWLIDGI